MEKSVTIQSWGPLIMPFANQIYDTGDNLYTV